MAAGGQHQHEFASTRVSTPSSSFRRGDYERSSEVLHSQQSRPLTQPDEAALDVQARGRARSVSGKTGRSSPAPSRAPAGKASSRSFSRTLSLRTRDKKRPDRRTSDLVVNGEGPDDVLPGPEQRAEQTGALEVIKKHWMLEEVLDVLETALITLPGGRDRRGGAIIIVQVDDKVEQGPLEVGKALLYLNQVPDDIVRGFGFTLIIDGRHSQWKGIQNALKSIQLVFAEHVFQAIVIKPRGLMQRLKGGAKKTKISFPMVTVETESDLWHHVGINQVPRNLSGNLVYDHREWLDSMKILDRLHRELTTMLQQFKAYKKKMEDYVLAPEVYSSHLMVKEHVELKEKITSDAVKGLAQRIQSNIGRLRMPALHPEAFTAMKHPDFVILMAQIEDMFGVLNDLFIAAERLWQEKSVLLDQCLQLRIFERDTEQFLEWVSVTGHEYLLSRTAVGTTYSQAQAAYHDHDHNRTRMMEKNADFVRVSQMGERLLDNQSYGCQEVSVKLQTLKCQWEEFQRQLQRWSDLFHHSSQLHSKAKEFMDNLRAWHEKCRPFCDPPDALETVENLQKQHTDMGSHYKSLLDDVCYHGNKMLEIMKEPISLTPSATSPNFSGSIHHVREVMDQAVLDEQGLSQQWNTHSLYLKQLLNLKKFALAGKKVKLWIEDRGANFLTVNTGIGTDLASAELLLKAHDKFEASAESIYAKAHQLMEEAKELSVAGLVNPDLMEDEVSTLEIAFGGFANQLDERREIILLAKDLHHRLDRLFTLYESIRQSLPEEGVPYDVATCESVLASFESTQRQVHSTMHKCKEAILNLKERMQDATVAAKRSEIVLDYYQAGSFLEKKTAEIERKLGEVEAVMGSRENLLNLSLRMRHFELQVRKFKGEVWYWLEVENGQDLPDSLMSARLKHDTFDGQRSSHIAQHSQLLALGEQLLCDLVGYETMITVSETDSTSSVSHVQQVMTDLRAFLPGMEEAMDQLKLKLEKCVELQNLKKAGHEMIAEINAVVDELLAVPGIGSHTQSSEKLRDRANNVASQLQGLSTSTEEFKKKAMDVAAAQPEFAEAIASVVSCVERDYAEAQSCMKLRQEVMGFSVDHYKKQDQLYLTCGDLEILFRSRDIPDSIETCMAERDNHQNRKEKLLKAVTSATSAGKILLDKLDTWNRLIQSRRDKIEEGNDAVPPLPSAPQVGDNGEACSRVPAYSVNLGEEEEVHGDTRSSTRRNSADMDYFDMIRDQGDSHSWRAGAVGYNSLPRKKRSSSVSHHSYSANRRLTSPRTLAGKRHHSATPSPPPKSTKPSQAPLSDPISIRRVSTSPKPEHDLKRHHSVDAVNPHNTGPGSAGSRRWPQLEKTLSNPGPIFFTRSQSSGHSSRSSVALDNQLSATVYQKCATWDEADWTRVQRMVEQAGERQARLLELWAARKTLLEHTTTLFQFRALAEEILHWHATECETFMADESFGDSIDDVEHLITRHQEFVEGQMPLYFSKVQRLFTWSKELEEAGNMHMQAVQTLAVDVSAKWRRGVDVATKRKSALQDTLTFHINLFEANNWCSKTYNTLEEMERKIIGCEHSADARELIGEVDGYITFTKGDQEARVQKLVTTARNLSSTHLQELAQQVDNSTKEYCYQFDRLKEEVERRESRLLQIEKEQDARSRALKQRDRVADELLETERIYCSALSTALKQYFPPLLGADATPPEGIRNRVGAIFGNLESVETYHREEFFPKLERCGKDFNKIAKLLLDEGSKMAQIYIGYCQGKTQSEALIIEHRPFFDRLQMQLRANESLSSYLIRPIQRITKFPLMLKDAIKYTRQVGEDTAKLTECLEIMSAIPKRTNDVVHLSALEDFDEPYVELGQLVHQGLLYMAESRALRTSEKERQLFLFTRAILVCRQHKRENGQLRYAFRHKISFATTNVKLQEYSTNDPAERCKFALILRGEQKQVYRAPDVASRREWVDNIRGILRSHKLSTYTLDSANKWVSREGRRRAVIGQLANMPTSDSDEGIINPSPLTVRQRRGIPRYNTISITGPTLIPNGTAHSGSDRSPSESDVNKFAVMEDYTPVEGSGGISLKAGDQIEVLHCEGEELWLGRTLSIKKRCGWVPPNILKRLSVSSLDANASSTSVAPSSPELPRRPASPDLPRRPASPLLSRKMVSTSSVTTGGHLLRPQSGSLPNQEQTLSRSRPSSPTKLTPPDHASVQVYATLSRAAKTLQTKSPTFEHRFWRRSGLKKKKKKGDGTLSDSGSSTPVLSSPRSSVHLEELDLCLPSQCTPVPPGTDRKKATIESVVQELLQSEAVYVEELAAITKGYMKKFQSPSELPDSLKDKKKMIFGHIRALHTFHEGTFMQLLQESETSHREVAESFLESASSFDMYVSFCENKPQADALLWGYARPFFESCQTELKLPKSLATYLTVPVSRLVQYEAYLKDMLLLAHANGLESESVKKAMAMIQGIKEKAGDSAQLGLIVGYKGSIHAGGSLLLHDDVVVSKGLNGSAKPFRGHLFLLDQQLVITQQQSKQMTFQYIDDIALSKSLIVDPPRDQPCRFSVCNFHSSETLDQYYSMEFTSNHDRDTWVGALQDALAKQLQILHSLRQDSTDNTTTGMSPGFLRERRKRVQEVAMTGDSDSSSVSEDWDTRDKRTSGLLLKGDIAGLGPQRQRSATMPSVSPSLEMKPSVSGKLYVVSQDWSPEKDDWEVIPEERMSPKAIHKGQVFDIVEQDAYWWRGRLLKDASPSSNLPVGKLVWLPSKQLERKKSAPLPPRRVDSLYSSVARRSSVSSTPSFPEARDRCLTVSLSVPSSGDTVSCSSSHFEEYPQSVSSLGGSSASLNSDSVRSSSQNNVAGLEGKFPSFVSQIGKESGSVGVSLKLTCSLEKAVPGLVIRWFHNGHPVTECSRRAILKVSNTCILEIVSLQPEDAGSYICLASNSTGNATASGELVVKGPPGSMHKPTIEYITESSIALSWSAPLNDGGSPITRYSVIVSTKSDEMLVTHDFPTTATSCLLETLEPGKMYIFRVRALNEFGAGETSEATEVVRLLGNGQSADGGLLLNDDFSNHYDVDRIIARGRFCAVSQCKQKVTNTAFAAKKYHIANLVQEWSSQCNDTEEVRKVVLKRVEQELEILKSLHHPCFPAALVGFASSSAFILVMELIEGRSVLDYIIDKDTLLESLVMDICKKLLEGVEYLHGMGVAHLDLHPENILAVEHGVAPNIKLVGFGNAEYIGPDRPKCMLNLSRVNMEFSAPEIIDERPVSLATDIWSVGVLVYVILTGLSPFAGSQKTMTMANISLVKLSLPQQYFADVSLEAKNFIKRLLVQEESCRLTATQCLNDPWLKSLDGDAKGKWLRRRSTDPKLDTSRLKVFNARRAWKSSLLSKRRSIGGAQPGMPTS